MRDNIGRNCQVYLQGQSDPKTAKGSFVLPAVTRFLSLTFTVTFVFPTKSRLKFLNDLSWQRNSDWCLCTIISVFTNSPTYRVRPIVYLCQTIVIFLA
jgi:hypothetical protein